MVASLVSPSVTCVAERATTSARHNVMVATGSFQSNLENGACQLDIRAAQAPAGCSWVPRIRDRIGARTRPSCQCQRVSPGPPVELRARAAGPSRSQPNDAGSQPSISTPSG